MIAPGTARATAPVPVTKRSGPVVCDFCGPVWTLKIAPVPAGSAAKNWLLEANPASRTRTKCRRNPGASAQAKPISRWPRTAVTISRVPLSPQVRAPSMPNPGVRTTWCRPVARSVIVRSRADPSWLLSGVVLASHSPLGDTAAHPPLCWVNVSLAWRTKAGAENDA